MNFHDYTSINTVYFTDLDQGRENLSTFSLPKSMKHPVGLRNVFESSNNFDKC
jgi:hypothetical protein